MLLSYGVTDVKMTSFCHLACIVCDGCWDFPADCWPVCNCLTKMCLSCKNK